MPVQGPSIHAIDDSAGEIKGFALVKLSPAVLGQLQKAPPPSFIATFGNRRPAPVRTIENGDILAITIWDAGGGLFSPQGPAQPGTQVTPIPNQTVDPKGTITVPFVGQLHVGGKSTVQAQNAIVNGLASQALKPQVLVSIVSDSTNLFTVIGDVKTPNQLPLNVNGTRVLDAIARAGGTTAPAFDTIVQLTRDGVAKRLRLSSLLAHPSENVYLETGDVVYVLRDPKFVAVLGATKTNMRLEFDAEHLTLAEVLGLSGGLVDVQAEPTGVFVFRLEPSGMVAALTQRAPPTPNSNAPVPVIFQTDLRAPEDFFLAQNFQMEDKDIVFVANAESVQLDKVLRIVLHAAEIVGIAVNRGGVATGQ
jgi:polysaccharide export outer membrane protein